MKKILVVDDEMTVRYMVTESLKEEGYDVVEARNGSDAINIAAAEQPDLIIMDNIMPEMDGLEAVGNLRQNETTRNIPVFISTADDKIKAEFSAENGKEVQGFLEKPYMMESLINIISQFFSEQ